MSETVSEVSPLRLTGIRVILTRPRHQCDALISMFESRGADARCLPVVEIEPPADPAPAAAALGELKRFNLVVFTSANAVRGALSINGELPRAAADIQVAAVGPATRRALEQAGMRVTIVPSDEFSSEGLLSHPNLDASELKGKNVLIVKGEGGRGLLAASLETTGAAVTAVDVYRRSRPEVKISELLGESLTEFDLIVLTSGTAVEHLMDVAGDKEKRQILSMPLVVSSERIARIVRRHGARKSPVVAATPEDKSLVEAVERWLESRAKRTR